jgi:hypothetical protein
MQEEEAHRGHVYEQDLLHLPDHQEHWQQHEELQSIHDENVNNEARDLQQDFQMEAEYEQVIEEPVEEPNQLNDESGIEEEQEEAPVEQ